MNSVLEGSLREDGASGGDEGEENTNLNREKGKDKKEDTDIAKLSKTPLRILEFYSGMGGMRMAFSLAGAFMFAY